METTIFPTLDEALHLHKKLVDVFGGQHGVRDMGLLESALTRPRTGYYNTLSAQAAALLQSLLLNHCFIDGNKRIAFALTATFLKLNGYTLKVKAKEAEKFLIQRIIVNKADINDIAKWTSQRITKNIS